MADIKQRPNPFAKKTNDVRHIDNPRALDPYINAQGDVPSDMAAFRRRAEKTSDDIVNEVNHYITYEYRKISKKPLSQHYVNGVLKNLKILIEYHGIKQPTVEAAINLELKLQKQGASGNTIHNYIYALRFWAYAEGMKFDLKIPGAMKSRKIVEPIDLKEVRSLVNEGDNRQGFITVLGSICGLRPYEIIGLKMEDLKYLDDGVINLPYTKDGQPHRAYATTQVIAIAKEYLVDREALLKKLGTTSEYVLITEDGLPIKPDRLYQIVRGHGKKVLGKKIGSRLLRTSCGTNIAMDQRANSSIAADALHHSDPRTTEKYYIKARQGTVKSVIEEVLRF